MTFWPASGGGGIAPAYIVGEGGGNPIFDAATANVTTEQDVLGNITVPAAKVGPHSRIVFECLVDSVNNANVKTVRPKIGGDGFGAMAVTSAAGFVFVKRLWARGAVNAWSTLPANVNDHTSQSGTLVAKTYDFATDKTFTLTFQTATAGDKMQLLHWRLVIENPAA